MTKKQNHWSVLRYLIYFTQVGVSVVTPPILCCFAALWLKRRFALGNGTVIIGIVLNLLLVYVVIKKASAIERLIGKNGLSVLRRIFGIILLAIAIQMFTTNLKTLL